MLNHDVNNPSSLGKGVPFPANFLACDMEQAAGENYGNGEFYSSITNETYSWHFNSNGIHHIQRINGDGVCEIVYVGDCLKLSANPANKITQFRAYLDVDYLCSKVPGGKLKRLIWVDGTDTPFGSLDVEASIATNFFTTPFFDVCADPCANIQLCVPEPEGCLNGEFVPFNASDALLPNKLVDKGIKVMFQYIYYDRRKSEWSDRSSLYFQDSKGCFDNGVGFSRCLKFRIPVGNPNVEKINFGFSEDGGLTWFLSETIEKYKQYSSAQQYWYQREFSEIITNTFDEDDCTFEYNFCNDKQRVPIAPTQVSREINPIPREAQGLFRIKDSFGVYNYVKGTCPIDKNEADKFDVQLVCADSTIPSCDVQNAKVTVRAIVYNNDNQLNRFIYRLNGSDGAKDDPTDAAWFGGLVFDSTPHMVTQFNQTFPDKTRNFIAYIEGTDYWGEMEQWHSNNGFRTLKKVGVMAGLSVQRNVVHRANDIANGNFFYQEVILTVPKGTKGFLRLTSHHQTNGLGNNQNTSTQVIGIMPDLRNYSSTHGFDIDANVKEIYFDTCDGDVELFDAFAVADLYTESGNGRGYDGYITDKSDLPVEGARVYISSSTYVATTDYNGFYSFNTSAGTSSAIALDIHVEQNCVGNFTTIESFNSQTEIGNLADVDYQIQSLSYRDSFYAGVNVPVKDCNNNPIPGLRVAMRGNKYKVTDANGIAHFRLRNYNSRNRSALGILMDKGNCFTVDCANVCHPCFPTTGEVALAACFIGNPQYNPTLSANLNTISLIANRKGLKHGGRYPFGWVLEGDCGKLSAVNEIKYIDIPSVQQSGTLDFCHFTFTGGNIKLPSWGKRLKIVRGTNLNPYDLQWVVDSIDRTSNGKIILTIQSLNDWNKQFNFKTNTIYKWLAGDRVEFIRNGNGSIFRTSVYGLLNYLTLSPFNDVTISGVTDNADYFNQLIIADDGKLDGLLPGAVIELQTPATATTEISYFEICASIPVIDGQLEVQSGTFTTFDTFLVNRQISKFPAQYFESKTPSDFWGGTNLDDTGKVHFVNKFENEARFNRNISINSPTQLNYFGDLEKTLDAADQGGIIGIALKGDKLGLAICENSPFLFQVSDQLVRVGSDNVIRATTADNVISNPEVNIRGDFGCDYSDIGSIFFGDGYAIWISSKYNNLIIHNYSFAKEAGHRVVGDKIETTMDSFFAKRIRDKESFNKTSTDVLNNYRFSVGFNVNNGVVYITLKSLRQPGINNQGEVYAAPNDTVIYNPEDDSYLGFASFTAEGYSRLNLNNDTGCAFIAYQNGLPYIHEILPSKWNEFFGIAVDEYVGVSINQFPNKIKVPVSLELQSDMMWYVKSVTTEMSQPRSEIPPIKMKQDQSGKWNSSFLNDINSRGGLYNGANMRGYCINVLFIRDNSLNLAYAVIDDAKRTKYSEMDSILMKVQVSEQSGFTENV